MWYLNSYGINFFPLFSSFLFFFFSFFFFVLFLYSYLFFTVAMSCVMCYLFWKRYLNWKKLILFIGFILHNYKIQVLYHPTEVHTFSFWLCYIRYALLITDNFPEEFRIVIHTTLASDNPLRFRKNLLASI